MSNPIRNTDPNDGPVPHSASGLPDGLALNPRTGVISGTIDLRPARPTEEGSPGREDVKPDLLIDPPDQDPDIPENRPPGADR
jgi:hypothetical protein